MYIYIYIFTSTQNVYVYIELSVCYVLDVCFMRGLCFRNADPCGLFVFLYLYLYLCVKESLALYWLFFLPYLPPFFSPLSLALSLCLSHYSVRLFFVLGVIYNLDLVNIVCSQTHTYTYSVVCV